MLDTYRDNHEARIRALAGFGHRGSATEHERRAQDYLCGQLESIGMESTREPFVGCQAFGPRLLLHVAIAMVGAACFWQWPLVASALGLVALVSLWVEHSRSRVWLSRPLMRFPSANIVGQSSIASPRMRVILSGHCDTQRAGFLWWIFAYMGPLFWWVPAFWKPPLTSLALTMLGQVVLGGVAVVLGLGFYISMANWIILGIYSLALLLLLDWTFGRYVQGAGDNAAGAAAVLTLGEAWRRQPVPGVELVLLLTGCEEVGLVGSAVWADRHQQELRQVPTVFLNLDNLGFGPPRFFRYEVPLCGMPVAYPPELVDLAIDTARELGLKDAGPHALPGPTDALSFLTRGMRGISIVSFGKWGFMPSYHRLRDTTEHLDFDAAWQAVVFGWAILQRIAQEGASKEALRKR